MRRPNENVSGISGARRASTLLQEKIIDIVLAQIARRDFKSVNNKLVSIETILKRRQLFTYLAICKLERINRAATDFDASVVAVATV